MLICWQLSSPNPVLNSSNPFFPTLQSQKLEILPESSNAAKFPNAATVCFVAAYHPFVVSKGTTAGNPLYGSDS